MTQKMNHMRKNWSDFSNVLMTATIVAVPTPKASVSRRRRSLKSKAPHPRHQQASGFRFSKVLWHFSLYPISVNQYINCSHVHDVLAGSENGKEKGKKQEEERQEAKGKEGRIERTKWRKDRGKEIAKGCQEGYNILFLLNMFPHTSKIDLHTVSEAIGDASAKIKAALSLMPNLDKMPGT